jgi:hypothetical protein
MLDTRRIYGHLHISSSYVGNYDTTRYMGTLTMLKLLLLTVRGHISSIDRKTFSTVSSMMREP